MFCRIVPEEEEEQRIPKMRWERMRCWWEGRRLEIVSQPITKQHKRKETKTAPIGSQAEPIWLQL
jgi:hypothetical protein